MTSREARQRYTGIHMPGERWRQLHIHFFRYKLVYIHIHTFKHNFQNFNNYIIFLNIKSAKRQCFLRFTFSVVFSICIADVFFHFPFPYFVRSWLNWGQHNKDWYSSPNQHWVNVSCFLGGLSSEHLLYNESSRANCSHAIFHIWARFNEISIFNVSHLHDLFWTHHSHINIKFINQGISEVRPLFDM